MKSRQRNRGSWRGTESLSKLGHEPVLLKEAIELLNIKPGGRYIDATLGAGGHSEEILRRGGFVLGIDQDKEALEIARRTMESRGWKVDKDFKIVHGNFRNIEEIAQSYGFDRVDGVIFDLGLSSMQIAPHQDGAGRGRGFSFTRDEPLDMRMDPENQGVTAADLINGLREDQLYELFSKTSPKNLARAIARVVTRARVNKRIERTSELVNLVMDKIGGRRKKIHPATTIFMALRMAVNSEIQNLEMGLAGAVPILGHSGRLVVISFHSGEDRVVKNFFREKQEEGVIKILTKNPVVPSRDELGRNPRARSAKLRAGENYRENYY